MTEFAIMLDDYPLLKQAYDRAVADNKQSFEFQGNTLVTEFAKYVLEYLKPQHEHRQKKYH